MSKAPKKPDWQNEADYAYVDKLGFLECAWEFLRRNPEYRDDYQKYLHERDESPKKLTSKKSHLIDDPKEKKRLLELEEQAINPHLKPLEQKYAERWCLKGMYDPELLYAQGVRFSAPSAFPAIILTPDDLDQYLDEENGITKVQDTLGVVAFDLSKPLLSQTVRAYKQLRKNIKKLQKWKRLKLDKPKTQRRTWKRHLRVLDALLLGVKSRDIFTIIVDEKLHQPETERSLGAQAYNIIKPAKNMANHGYKDLISRYLSDKNKV